MATAKTVTVNYTAEQTAELKAAYVAAPNTDTVASFAVKYGKGIRSIVAKLSREGVYVAKEYKSKTGETPVRKDAHADAIGKILNLSENDTSSLSKANKVALTKVFCALANSVPMEAETPEQTATKGVFLADIREFGLFDETDMSSFSRVNTTALSKLAQYFNTVD